MKHLYLVRHANAGWSNSNQADFDRTLSGQGRREASVMASRLLEQGVRPEIVVTSPAARARETAELFGEIMGFGMDAVREAYEIYAGDTGALAGIVSGLPEEYRSAMLFGHNPTVSILGSWLAGKQLGQMSTCGILRLELQVGRWAEGKEGCAEAVWYMHPDNRQ